jgi:hypothetical protein
MAVVNSNYSSEVYANILRIVYYILSICGLIFSSILLYILSKRLKKTKHSDIILTIIVVTVDGIASSGLLFRAIFTQYPYNILKVHYNWCAYDIIINGHVLIFSGYSLSILSVQRMLLIVFNIRINIWFWLTLTLILNFSLWGLDIYQIVIKNIKLSGTEVFCILSNNTDSRPLYYMLIGYTLLTYSLTVISYLIIITFSCKQCLKQLDLNLEKSVVYKECRVIVFKYLFFLIPYMMIYAGRIYCWIYEFSTGAPRTFTMEYVSIILNSSCVVINSLTVLYMNKEINREFLNLIFSFKSIFYRQS